MLTPMTDKQLSSFLTAERSVVERLCDKHDAQDKLLHFMRLGWHALEPGTPLQIAWPLEAICEHLEAVTRSEIRRLLINVPPGFSKSMSTNVFWPAWEWGPRDLGHHRFISASHEQDLSVRDNVRSRDLVLSEWYRENWGERFELKGDQNAKLRYENSKTGWRMASSVGSGLTGHRGDRIILDDPHAVRDLESEPKREGALRWFSETLPTRLNNQAESAIVVIMQRVHARDVSGLILKNELGYEWLCLPMEYESKHRCFTSVPRAGVAPVSVAKLTRDGAPLPRWVTETELEHELKDAPLAEHDRLSPFSERWPWDSRMTEGELLWPERFPGPAVEELKKAFRAWGGSYAEAGQLQQRPAPRGGGMFKREDFQYIDKAPPGVRWVRGYDLASTKEKHSAWTAAVKLGIAADGRVIIADVVRDRLSPGEVDGLMLRLAKQDGPNVMIDFPQDPGQAGVAQVAAIGRLLVGFDAHSTPETGSKEDRARPLAAACELKNLYLVRAPWVDAFINEATLFPNGDYLDQVDAASRAFSRCLTMGGQRRPGMGVVVTAETAIAPVMSDGSPVGLLSGLNFTP